MLITTDMLKLAAQIVTESEHDLVRVVDSITNTYATKHIDEIMHIVRRYKQITRQTLWRHCIRQMTEMEFINAINACINADYMTQTVSHGRVTYRPVPIKPKESE